MRQVLGKTTRELDAAQFAELRAGYATLVLDVGTGDGKHVLSEARRRPDALVVGLDAGPDAMRASGARAAAKPARGGTPNALFVWAAAERLPPELHDVDELHCLMPWGSLLRALVGPDHDVLTGLAAICTRGAPFLITLNLHAWRPPVPEVGTLPEPTPESMTDRAGEYADCGWLLQDAGYLTAAQSAELGTSWTKRLGASRDLLDALAVRGTIAPPG